MEILLIIIVALIAYFVWWRSTIGYQYRSVIRRSQEVKKAINSMSAVASRSGNQNQNIPHLEAAERNLNRIMAKYSNDKAVCRSAISDFARYLEASVAMTTNKINIMSDITSASDALSAMKKLESDDTGYVLEQVSKRQKELLGDEYVEVQNDNI